MKNGTEAGAAVKEQIVQCHRACEMIWKVLHGQGG
jgi:hypothetical protein